MKIPFGRPQLGSEERNAVQEVLSGDILVHGPKAHDFERDFAAFTGAPFAVSLSSCTAALHLAYFYLGIGPGDEVIVPAQTHTATAHAVELCGATPVFVDAELLTGNLDISRVEDSITPRTRALSVVHFLGMPVAMDNIMSIARKHSLFVVEDCALALGSRFDGIHVGLHGDVGCFSFYPVKHMTTSEGGMLITRHKEIADRIRLQRAFGVDRTAGERQIPGIYDVIDLGFNYRMSEIEAAIGIEQLKKMPSFLRSRKENFEELSRSLADLPEIHLFESGSPRFENSYYCLSVMVKDDLAPFRNAIIEFLNRSGVGTSIYYPRPVPLMAYYQKKYGFPATAVPSASAISNRSIALPVGPHISHDEVRYIGSQLIEAIRAVRDCGQ